MPGTSWPPPYLDAVAIVADRFPDKPVTKEPERNEPAEGLALVESTTNAIEVEQDELNCGSALLDEMRVSAGTGDISNFVAALCEGLGYSDPVELLPLLRDVVAEVVKIEDEISTLRAAKAHNSAFKKYEKQEEKRMGENKSSKENRDQIAREGARRWRKTMRAMFTIDAATAMLNELRAGYESESFATDAERLNDLWLHFPDRKFQEQQANVEDLCLRTVLCPVLERYGFHPNRQGSNDMTSVIMHLSSNNKSVMEMNLNLQKQLYSFFPNVGCNG